jgi:hypothetical protein
VQKIRSAIVATIGTREDLTRVMDAKYCIALMTVVEATRLLAREVGEEDFAKPLAMAHNKFCPCIVSQEADTHPTRVWSTI